MLPNCLVVRFGLLAAVTSIALRRLSRLAGQFLELGPHLRAIDLVELGKGIARLPGWPSFISAWPR